MFDMIELVFELKLRGRDIPEKKHMERLHTILLILDRFYGAHSKWCAISGI